MSKLNELIDKTIHDIKFNGCTLPESIIRLQLDNIAACAKYEESIEEFKKYILMARWDINPYRNISHSYKMLNQQDLADLWMQKYLLRANNERGIIF